MLRGAVEAGVTLIDTADLYGPHTNELLIRDALHPYPEGLLIATKGGMVRGGRELSTIDAVGNPNYLRQCAYLSARRLGVDQIGLYYLHSPWARDASFEDQVGTLAELREGRRDRSYRPVECLPRSAARSPADHRDRRRHRVLQCRRQAARRAAGGRRQGRSGFCPWQPVSLIQPGVQTDTSGPQAIRRVLAPIASRHGATIPQVALAWLLARSPAMLPIPATTSVAICGETWPPRTWN